MNKSMKHKCSHCGVKIKAKHFTICVDGTILKYICACCLQKLFVWLKMKG